MPTTDWYLTGVLLLAIALGLEGMHDIDLADPDVAVTIDPQVQRSVRYALVGAGVLVGIYLASLTSWLLVGLVVLEATAGLAYNGEWFGGLFHDIDQLGWATAAVALGFVPVAVGHYALAQSVTVDVLLWGAVAAAYSVGILHVYQVVKVPVLYERVGIEHDRAMEMTDDEAYRTVTTGLGSVILGTILTGIAFTVTTLGL